MSDQATTTPAEYAKLPFGQIVVTHGFPDRKDWTGAVYVDGKPVARLPITNVGFEQSYSDGFGYVTLRLIAGDCQILASRPNVEVPTVIK